MFKHLLSGFAAAAQDGGQCTVPAKNHAVTRYNGPNRINTGDMKNSRPARTFSVTPGKPAFAAAVFRAPAKQSGTA
jgi:hypothetical protein